jgi:hypothetical protein
MSRDRDRTLEQALKHELGASGTPDRDACLDAETLGAWADGGLDRAQMTAVELHVSTCARCLAIAAATARSVPVASGAEAAGGFFRWRWWLAPVAATAAAVTLWIVVPGQRDIGVAPPSGGTPATEALARPQPRGEAPAEPSPAKPAEEPTASVDQATRANTPAIARAERRERQADAAENKNAENKNKEERLAAKKDQDAPKLLQDTNAGAVATTVAPVTAPAPATAAAPAPAPAPAPPPSARASASPALQKLQGFAFAPIQIVSPDPSRRWRIANGAIERSDDGGASWTVVRPLAGDAITGGTAPAPSICWLIGSGGLVMVTADGLTFARVPLPERVDLTAVTATDARTAIVTTADGRRFRTGDAGRTWQRN